MFDNTSAALFFFWIKIDFIQHQRCLSFVADTSASGPTVLENGDHGIEDHRPGKCLMSE